MLGTIYQNVAFSLARAGVGRLVGVYDSPNRPVVYIVYAGRIVGGEPHVDEAALQRHRVDVGVPELHLRDDHRMARLPEVDHLDRAHEDLAREVVGDGGQVIAHVDVVRLHRPAVDDR